MAKRFTATEKWDDPWFCSLTSTEKLFWEYLCDKCNHAGIWQVNFTLAKFHIPELDFNRVKFEGRIIFLSEEKWFLKKFVEFQYGHLNPKNRVHASILHQVGKEGAIKGLTRGLLAPMDMDMDMELDKDKVKDVGILVKGTKPAKIAEWFEKTWAVYPRQVGKKEAFRHYCKDVKTLDTAKEVMRAVENYKAKITKDGTEERYIKNGSTFFNNWRDYADRGSSESLHNQAAVERPDSGDPRHGVQAADANRVVGKLADSKAFPS